MNQLRLEEKSERSLQRRVFLGFVTVAVVATLVVTAVVTLIMQRSLISDAHSQLGRECWVLSSYLNESSDDVQSLKMLDFDEERATLVAPDGTVLFDNEANPAEMPNHKDRPEIASAMATGRGSAERQSPTVGYVSIYESICLDDGSVLRLSEDRAGVLAQLGSYAGWVALLIVLLAALSWLVSLFVSRKLVQPILDIDPSKPDRVSPYKELEPLVDHLREQQTQLERQMDMLRDADMMRQEFTANVTHELKTPIASISGASELIREGLVRPEDVGDFANRIYKESQHLSNLVSDILTLSKLDESERSKDMVLLGSSQPCDLRVICRDVMERYQHKARQMDVHVVLEGYSVMIDGYPRLLDELVGNLVSNAIRYNKKGGLVRISCGRIGMDVNGNYVEGAPNKAAADEASEQWPLGSPFVRVSDTGVGIPADSQDKVFERFYRVHKSRSRASGGTGLGLAIVKHSATAHDATVNLSSELGKGTTIQVTFPSSRMA